MERHWAIGLRGFARVFLEASVFVLVVTQAICSLSGWSLLGLLGLYDNETTQTVVTNGNRVYALSPAVQDMMKQVGIVHSACYEQDRTSPKEFILCMGRAECAHAKNTGDVKFISAPEALETPEGKRKVLEVTHAVLSHLAKQAQTSDLKVLMEKVLSLGLACDNFFIT